MLEQAATNTSEQASQDNAQAISRLNQGTALDTLGCTAHRLAQACQDYRRVADAILFVCRAATEANRAWHDVAETEWMRVQ